MDDITALQRANIILKLLQKFVNTNMSKEELRVQLKKSLK